jgi:hypothetical protein
MRKMNLIHDDKFRKNYHITGKAKHNSKRKKIYICEQTLNNYLWKIRKMESNKK